MKNKQSQFLLIFISTIGVYYTSIAVFGISFLKPYIDFTAWLAGIITKIFYSGVFTSNGIINLNGSALQVAFGCDGTDQFIVFIAGVLAFPTDWKQKREGLLKGLLLLYVLNLFRIIALLLIMINWNDKFDIYHELVFPALFIFLSISFWIYWLRNLKRD